MSYLANRIYKAYVRAISKMGNPTFEVVLNESTWTYPPNIVKDKTMDGWYNELTGEVVDPSTFWNTKQIEMVFGEPTLYSSTIFEGGFSEDKTITLYTSGDNYNDIKDMYGVIINNKLFRPTSISPIPNEDDVAVVFVEAKGYDLL